MRRHLGSSCGILRRLKIAVAPAMRRKTLVTRHKARGGTRELRDCPFSVRVWDVIHGQALVCVPISQPTTTALIASSLVQDAPHEHGPA